MGRCIPKNKIHVSKETEYSPIKKKDFEKKLEDKMDKIEDRIVMMLEDRISALNLELGRTNLDMRFLKLRVNNILLDQIINKPSFQTTSIQSRISNLEKYVDQRVDKLDTHIQQKLKDFQTINITQILSQGIILAVDTQLENNIVTVKIRLEDKDKKELTLKQCISDEEQQNNASKQYQ